MVFAHLYVIWTTRASIRISVTCTADTESHLDEIGNMRLGGWTVEDPSIGKKVCQDVRVYLTLMTVQILCRHCKAKSCICHHEVEPHFLGFVHWGPQRTVPHNLACCCLTLRLPELLVGKQSC